MPFRGSATKHPLRALLIEDNPSDVTLNLYALSKSGFVVTHEVVESASQLVAALGRGPWDVVLSDYHLPGFNAPAALAIVREHSPNLPFILVSGTIDEDSAVDVMRGGANDYIIKGKLRRLGAAIAREVRSAEVRRDQAKAELELHENRELNQVLLAQSSDWVSIVGADGICRFMSPPVERYLGYTPADIIGNPASMLIHEDEVGTMRESMMKLLADPSTPITAQVRARHKNGSVHEVETTIRNLLGHPVIRGFVASTRDISQRQAVEAERRARIVAELANKTKSTFLANMSHELRTPLNAIIGFSELLEQGIAGPLSTKQEMYVDNVLQSGRHLLSLVNDILDLSKVEAGKLRLNREWTSLEALAHSISETVGPLLARSKVSFEIEVPKSLPLLYVDPIRLKQILFNLVSNGIKFNREGGHVRLSAAPHDRGVQIRIEDTGIGIGPEDVPRLFREFERLETSSHEGITEGTGLGLALTRRLVEIHGGSIGVTSAVGRGSTFTIDLPDVQRPQRNSEPPSMNMRARSVLVADADEHSRTLVAQHLRAAGLHPLLARTADEALHMAAHERPALIALDILLAVTPDETVLERLKQTPETAKIPVVIVSIDDDRTRSLALGAAAHLTKPVTRESLHDAVRSAGLAPRPVAGKRVLVVGSGNELDRVAQELVEAGAMVDRRSSVGEDSVHCDVAVVDADQAAAAVLAALPAPPPVVAIVDDVPDTSSGDVSFIERRELRAPEVVSAVHQSIFPPPDSPGDGKPPSQER